MKEAIGPASRRQVRHTRWSGAAFVAIYLAARWHHTAIYEDGSYLDQVGAPEFNRVTDEA